MTDFHSNGNGTDHDRPESLRDMLRTHIVEQRDFNKKVERLHTIVLGDDEAKIRGVVHKVDDHGKYISMDKKLKWIGAGTIAAGGAGMGLWDSIKHLLFK